MPQSRRRWPILIALLAVAVAAAGGAYRYWPRAQPTFLTLYGNVDVRQVDLAFNASGRLQQLHKEEGDAVKAGETVAVMEADTYRDAVALARARLDAQRAVVDRLEAGSRPEEVARDRAQVDANRAAVADAELLLKRRTELVASGNVSRQLYDEAKNAYDSARARLDLSQQVSRLTELGPRREDIEQAKALVRSEDSIVSLAERRLADTVLKSPADGIVLSRIVEPGAMVSPANPIFTVSLVDKVWVRTYVSEPDLGRIRPGMAVTVVTDTDPTRPYEGWIGFISPTAEFTPKTVETTELRTQLVYRLRVFIKTPDDRLRQGMPVTVRVPLGAG
jgi:HlyD family secretion protein